MPITPVVPATPSAPGRSGDAGGSSAGDAFAGLLSGGTPAVTPKGAHAGRSAPLAHGGVGHRGGTPRAGAEPATHHGRADSTATAPTAGKDPAAGTPCSSGPVADPEGSEQPVAVDPITPAQIMAAAQVVPVAPVLAAAPSIGPAASAAPAAPEPVGSVAAPAAMPVTSPVNSPVKGSPQAGAAQVAEQPAADAVPAGQAGATTPSAQAPSADATTPTQTREVATAADADAATVPAPVVGSAAGAPTSPAPVAAAAAAPTAPRVAQGPTVEREEAQEAGADSNPALSPTGPAVDPQTTGTAPGTGHGFAQDQGGRPTQHEASPAVTTTTATTANPNGFTVPSPTMPAPVADGPAASATTVTGQVFPEVTRLVSRGDGTHRITMKLAPEALGEVRVVLSVRDGNVHVRLSGSHAAQQALLSGSGELHRLLEAVGAGTTEVTVGDRSSQGGLSQDATDARDRSQDGTPFAREQAQGQNPGHTNHRTAGTRDGDTSARDGATTGVQPHPSTDPAARKGDGAHARLSGVDVTM